MVWPAWPRRARSKWCAVSGTFLDPHHLEVSSRRQRQKSGGKKVVRFHKAIIAAGSQAVKLPFIPEDPRVVDSTGALLLDVHSEAHAGHRRRHHRAGDGHRLLDARHPHRRGRDARRPDDRRRSRPGQGVGEDERAALRQRDAEDQDRRRGGHAGRHRGELRGREGAGGAAGLRPGAGGGGPQPERQEDRRRQGGRRRHRSRLHRGRQADAHQHAAHLRDRRHRRPADAGAQGGARSARGGRSRSGRTRLFDARQIPSVAYTDPEVAWAGLTEEQCKAQGIKYGKAVFPWAASRPRDRQRPRRGLHQAASSTKRRIA